MRAQNILAQVGKSEQALAKAQIESFHRALASYRLDVVWLFSFDRGRLECSDGQAPGRRQVGRPLPHQGSSTGSLGASPIIYRAPGAKGDYDLLSHGKDGQPGGSGDAADVSGD